MICGGVSGAGQSNLSTGIAALIQDQLVSAPPRPESPEEQDYLEVRIHPFLFRNKLYRYLLGT